MQNLLIRSNRAEEVLLQLRWLLRVPKLRLRYNSLPLMPVGVHDWLEQPNLWGQTSLNQHGLQHLRPNREVQFCKRTPTRRLLGGILPVEMQQTTYGQRQAVPPLQQRMRLHHLDLLILWRRNNPFAIGKPRLHPVLEAGYFRVPLDDSWVSW